MNSFSPCSLSSDASATRTFAFPLPPPSPTSPKMYLLQPEDEGRSGVVAICVEGRIVEACCVGFWGPRTACFGLPAEGAFEVLWMKGVVTVWFEGEQMTITLLRHILCKNNDYRNQRSHHFPFSESGNL